VGREYTKRAKKASLKKEQQKIKDILQTRNFIANGDALFPAPGNQREKKIQLDC